jgi:hypothetical protein
MLGVGCNGDQGLGRDLEQQAIDDRLVVIGDVGDLSRQGEDDMEVGNRQQFGLAAGMGGTPSRPAVVEHVRHLDRWP